MLALKLQMLGLERHLLQQAHQVKWMWMWNLGVSFSVDETSACEIVVQEPRQTGNLQLIECAGCGCSVGIERSLDMSI